MKTQFIAEIYKIETMEDGLKMVIYTNELAPDELALLMALRGKQGMMLFKSEIENYTEEEVKDLPDVKLEKDEKSPSTQMRNIIYRIWENNTDHKKPFPDYYKAYMFTLNEKLKDKIDKSNGLNTKFNN